MLHPRPRCAGLYIYEHTAALSRSVFLRCSPPPSPFTKATNTLRTGARLPSRLISRRLASFSAGGCIRPSSRRHLPAGAADDRRPSDHSPLLATLLLLLSTATHPLLPCLHQPWRWRHTGGGRCWSRSAGICTANPPRCFEGGSLSIPSACSAPLYTYIYVFPPPCHLARSLMRAFRPLSPGLPASLAGAQGR